MSRDKDNTKGNIYCSKYNKRTQNTPGINIATNVKIEVFQESCRFPFMHKPKSGARYVKQPE